jgi:tetratricopeptide (TPR) repeat protein
VEWRPVPSEILMTECIERSRDMTIRTSANREMAEALIKFLEADGSLDAIARVNNLAVKLGEGGENDIARLLLEKALPVYEALYGEDTALAIMLLNTGHRYLHEKDYATARVQYERALAIQERGLASHGKMSWIRQAQARSLLALGTAWHQEADEWEFDNKAKFESKIVEARACFQRALPIFREVLGPKHLETAECLIGLARTLRLVNLLTGFTPQPSRDDADLAIRYQEQALEIRETQLGHSHPDTISSLFELAFESSNAGDEARTRCYFEQLLKLFEAKAADKIDPSIGNRFLRLHLNVDHLLTRDENDAAHRHLMALFPGVFMEPGGIELPKA